MSKAFKIAGAARRSMRSMTIPTQRGTAAHLAPALAGPQAPAARPPGPSPRWWGLPLLWAMRRDYLAFEENMRRRHGALCFLRLGQERAWNLMSPALVREALVDHADALIRWERGVEVFAQTFGQSVLVTEGSTWQRQRRMLMPAFSPRRVAGYAGLMCDAGQRALEAAVPPGQREATVRMDTLWNGVTMEVILHTLFGPAAHADAQALSAATQTLSAIGFQEMFYPWTAPDWLPLPGKAAKRRALKTLRQTVQRQIDAHGPGAEGAGLDCPPEDLLSMLLALRDEASGQALSPQELFDQCMVTFQAGHETTATALLWWSRLMADHPEAAARAQAEVDQRLQGRVPTAADAPALQWLNATLKEALRLYPPAAALMTRRTTAPISLGGYVVPAGHLLRITPWLLHRDDTLFPQATSFRPERFLDEAVPPPRGAWMPFGTGPRVCIGQHFALLEMTLLAALLLQRYALAPPADDAPWTPVMHVTLRPAGPALLRLQRRQR